MVESLKKNLKNQIMQSVLEVVVLEYSLPNHSQGILGVHSQPKNHSLSVQLLGLKVGYDLILKLITRALV